MAELCLFFLLLPVERPERESITCRPLIFFCAFFSLACVLPQCFVIWRLLRTRLNVLNNKCPSFDASCRFSRLPRQKDNLSRITYKHRKRNKPNNTREKFDKKEKPAVTSWSSSSYNRENCSTWCLSKRKFSSSVYIQQKKFKPTRFGLDIPVVVEAEIYTDKVGGIYCDRLLFPVSFFFVLQWNRQNWERSRIPPAVRWLVMPRIKKAE